ncbi:MAG: hypothetical protein JW818_04675, partial [Pirellulales bacterium]|nr:hypothetical protein [Pirellulales bacterium]
AGEWIVGGVEAKGFSFVFVFLGLEALVRQRWNRTWLLLGLASMFHVLVGGWSAIAAGAAWVFWGRDQRPPLRSMWAGLLGGFLLSLPALIPSLRLTLGVDPAIVDQANQIYVFIRLGHHLNPLDAEHFPPHLVIRFAVLLAVWVWLRWQSPRSEPVWRLHAFVTGSVVLSMVGLGLAYALAGRADWTAAVLRFYWFRLADVAVPMGVALGLPGVIERLRAVRPRLARAATVGLILLAVAHVGNCAQWRIGPVEPRGYRMAIGQFLNWKNACLWIADPKNIPPDARFLTPQYAQTFKWYAGRSEVVNWKDFPQDPASIVEWWQSQNLLHATGSDVPGERWYASLAEQDPVRLILLGKHFDADYLLTESAPPLALPVVYRNDAYAVYRLGPQRQAKNDQ